MKKRSQSVNVKHRKISFGDFQTETIGISVKKILIEVPYSMAQEENRKKAEIIASKDATIAKLNKEVERLKNNNLRAIRRKQVEEATERNLKNSKHVAKRIKQKKARIRKK